MDKWKNINENANECAIFSKDLFENGYCKKNYQFAFDTIYNVPISMHKTPELLEYHSKYDIANIDVLNHMVFLVYQ